jgi:hypothetical protein
MVIGGFACRETVKLALIERVAAVKSLKTPTHFRSADDEMRWLIGMDIWTAKNWDRNPRCQN